MTNIDYLYNKDAAKNFFGKDHFVDKELRFQIIERGTILPHKIVNIKGWSWDNQHLGGLFDKDGKFITNSYINNNGMGGSYAPPQHQFNIVTKRSFTS